MQARRSSLHCLQLLAGCACARFWALKPMKTMIVSDAKIRMLLSSPLSFCATVAQRFEMTLGVLPVDHSHKAINVPRGFGVEVHLIGVLVHIERQDGCAPASVWQ
jgi:hypothetical protein